MLRGLALVAGVLAAAVPAARPLPHVAGCARADFPSAGTTVRAARCGPPSGPRAVIVLHGCGGFDTFDHRLAAELPRYGIATLYVDYFEPTPPPGAKSFCGGPAAGADPFPTWERVALYVYGNGTHNWPRAQGTAGIRRAAAFLDRYLR